MERKNKKVKSKGNGEGTIYFSETLQKYVAQYVEPSTGKRKTLTQKKNEKVSDFKKRFYNIINEINNNTYIVNNDTSLYNILKDYIENTLKTGIITERSYVRNIWTLKLLEKTCKSFIYQPIQKVSISQIKKALPNFVELETIDAKTNEKVVKKYSQQVIDKLYMLLSKGFRIATSERIIPYNIMENESIQKPKSKKAPKKVEALTIEEQKKLVSVLENSDYKYKDIILLSLYTGMRIGEVLALSRNNIDLKSNTIQIERTLTSDKNDKVILGSKTKTKTGQRIIYLSNNAMLVLKRAMLAKVTNIYNLIFYNYQKNTFITPNEINCFLQRLNQKYKICGHIHTHMLRHTFATRCIEAGMSAKVLQKILGHRKIETTLDTYTSVFEKFNKDENEKYNLYMQENGL